jgi:flavin-dependent dehydrogenase
VGRALTIVGCGPAGAVAAWTAARAGLDVEVFERSGFPRQRVCGEFISAEALPLLRRIVPDLVEAAPAITHARLVAPSGAASRFALPAPARGISRWALDDALAAAAAAAGACLRLRTPAPPEAYASGAILAAGRDWRASSSPWLGVKAHLRGLASSGEVEMYFFAGGYCGLAPVETGCINACCLIHRRHAADLRTCRDFLAWLRASARSRPLQGRLQGARQATPSAVTMHVRIGERAAVTPQGALLAGDASGFVAPFTGDGLARAMLSGALAAEYAAHGDSRGYGLALRRAARPGFRAAAALRLLPRSALVRLAAPALARRFAAATRWRS